MFIAILGFLIVTFLVLLVAGGLLFAAYLYFHINILHGGLT